MLIYSEGQIVKKQKENKWKKKKKFFFVPFQEAKMHYDDMSARIQDCKE